MKLTLDEQRTKRDRIRRDLAHRRQATASSGNAERIAELEASIEELDARIADDEALLDRVRELAKDSAHREEISESDSHERNRRMKNKKDNTPGGEARDAAMRTLDDVFERGDIDGPSGERLVDVLKRDAFGLDARYVTAISSAAYASAFSKKLRGVDGAEGTLNPAEAEAVQKVGRAMSERSLAIGEGETGGFAVPIAIDPTIITTSEGQVNPLRALASVSTIATSEWRGVSSEGVTAAFAKEGEEVGDGSFKLKQPTIKPEKAHAFVPFSIEAGEDWPGIQPELARLFTEAKEMLEATKLTSGSGTDEPFGIVTGSTEITKTATENVLATADPYAAQDALLPRWQPGASWLTSLTIGNVLHRFVGGGSTEPGLFNPERTKLLAKPWAELSTLDTAVASGKKVAIYGDIKAFKVIDRLGMRVEIVPHIMGENGRPLGVRGLYAYWRVGSKVVNPKALRVLEIK